MWELGPLCQVLWVVGNADGECVANVILAVKHFKDGQLRTHWRNTPVEGEDQFGSEAESIELSDAGILDDGDGKQDWVIRILMEVAPEGLVLACNRSIGRGD